MPDMPGNHRLSKSESRSPVWNLRGDDSPGTVASYRENGLSESLKARILRLRATLYEVNRLVKQTPDSETREQISQRITTELDELEWDLLS